MAIRVRGSSLAPVMTLTVSRLMELQVLTLLLVNKFSFEPDAEIKFVPTQMNVFPALEGKYEEGSKLPLKVKTLAV